MKNVVEDFVCDPPSLKISARQGVLRNFKKVRENFKCENCGYLVKGDGYTDHCPKCLWGKHVDEEIPGDRASMCKGLMKPIRSEYQNGDFKIFYKCEKCNHKFWVHAAVAKAKAGQGVSEGDNRDLLVDLGI